LDSRKLKSGRGQLALATKGNCQELLLVQLDSAADLNQIGAFARRRSDGTPVELATPAFGPDAVLVVSDIKATTAAAGRNPAIAYDDNYLPLLLALLAFMVASVVGAGDLDHDFLQLLAVALGLTWRFWSPGSSRWALRNPSTGTCMDKLLDSTRGNSPRFDPDSIAQLVRNGWYEIELIDVQHVAKRVKKGVGSCDFVASYLPDQWAVRLDALQNVGIDESPSIRTQLPIVAGTAALAGGAGGERAFKPLRGPRRDLQTEFRPSRAAARSAAGGNAMACPSLLAPFCLLLLLLLKGAGLASGSGLHTLCIGCFVFWHVWGGPLVQATEAGPH
jgi:hypothetical protein